MDVRSCRRETVLARPQTCSDKYEGRMAFDLERRAALPAASGPVNVGENVAGRAYPLPQLESLSGCANVQARLGGDVQTAGHAASETFDYRCTPELRWG